MPSRRSRVRPDSGDVSIEQALKEGVDLLSQLGVLLAVPALVSLFNVGEFQAVLDHRGGHAGVELPFPVPVGDLWTFVNTPTTGSGVTVQGPGGVAGSGTLAFALVGFLAYTALYAVVAAGYVGSIQEYRSRGSYDFLANARRYALAYLGVTAVVFGTALLVVLLALASPGAFGLAVLLVLAIGYLFWGAWFLVPIADLDAVEALRLSAELALSRSVYAVWSAVHLAVGGVVSLVLTTVVVGAGIGGVLVGLAVAVPAGFVLTVGSLHVVDGLVGPPAEPRGRSPTGPRDPSG